MRDIIQFYSICLFDLIYDIVILELIFAFISAITLISTICFTVLIIFKTCDIIIITFISNIIFTKVGIISYICSLSAPP